MDNGILIIAHAPLASALRQCVAHVFPDQLVHVLALDVQATAPAAASLEEARRLLAQLGARPVLLLTDMLGGTPCNVACRLAGQAQPAGRVRLAAGVNMPMLLRAVTYRGLALPLLLGKVLDGGVQGIVEVPAVDSASEGQS
jgi:PTS system ascorbate-specific IIA component